MNKYNKEAVQKAIDRDKSISKKEAKLIHALLKGNRALAMLSLSMSGGSKND